MGSRPKFMSSSNKLDLKLYTLVKRSGKLVKVLKSVIKYNKKKSKERKRVIS